MAEDSDLAESDESGERSRSMVREDQPSQQEIGEQIGIGYRAPTFEQHVLKASPDYLGVSSLTYFADEFNRNFLGDNHDVLSTVVNKIGYSGSVGYGLTAELGLWPKPGDGLGPFASASGNFGFTSEGRLFFQGQLALGLGFGSFIGAGPTIQGTKGANPAVGLDAAISLQLVGNMGKGESVGFQLQIPIDGNLNFATDMPKVPLKNSWGYGEHIALSVNFSETVTFPRWDELLTAGGRLIYETEIQLYQWSRVMRSLEDR